jgi:hypothetical protein
MMVPATDSPKHASPVVFTLRFFHAPNGHSGVNMKDNGIVDNGGDRHAK